MYLLCRCLLSSHLFPGWSINIKKEKKDAVKDVKKSSVVLPQLNNELSVLMSFRVVKELPFF